MVYSDIHIPLPGFIALDWALMTIALIPILIRASMYIRSRGRNSLASSVADGFVGLAWISGCVFVSINTWKNRLRTKYLSAPPETLYYGVPREISGNLLFASWIGLFFVYTSLWSTKAAFLAFYWSIFSSRGRTVKDGLAIVCIFTAAMFILHILLVAIWCSPISSNWSSPPGGHLCSAVHNMSSVTISTFTTIATDLIILGIPIRTLLAKKLSHIQWASLALVLFMGSVSILAALARFLSLKLVQSTSRASITHTIDVWTLVEIVSSILAVCLPSLRTLIERYRSIRPKGATEMVDSSLGRVRSEGRSEGGAV